MMAENETGEKVDFSGTKATDPEKNKWSRRKIKIAVAVLVVIVSLAVAAATLAFFLKKRSPTRLAEVKLEEGDTMVYRVDQKLEVRGGDAQNGTVNTVVGLRVLNKTSEEYWFFMKIIVKVKGGNDSMNVLDPMMNGYFLVKLHTTLRLNSNYETEEPFEVFGKQQTDARLVHYVYGVLEQLLPALRRDLYEEVDGIKEASSKEPRPEKSPMLPGAVKMHREANTSDENVVLIKNRFNSSDLVDKQLKIDMDVKYSGSASINKSSGMVSESFDSVSEHLNFGEAIQSKSRSKVTAMDITFSSHVSLIETNSGYLAQAEVEAVNLKGFRKLNVPNVTRAGFDKKREWPRGPSYSSHASSNGSVDGQRNSTLLTERYRRNLVRKKRSVSVPFVTSYTLFEGKVLGVTIKGEGKAWLELDYDRPREPHVGVNVTLKLGFIDVPVFDYRYPEHANSKPTEIRWSKKVPYEVPVWGPFSVGVEFEIKGTISIAVNLQDFPSIKIEPFAEVKTTITGYGSIQVFLVGIYGEGTLIRASLPLQVSYKTNYPVLVQGAPTRLLLPRRHLDPLGSQLILSLDPGIHNQLQPTWCLAISAKMTALELAAGISYKRWRCSSKSSFWKFWKYSCIWGAWEKYKEFGKWAAIEKEWEIYNTCHD